MTELFDKKKERNKKKRKKENKKKDKKIEKIEKIEKNAIVQSIKQNYIFYFTLFACIFSFSFKHCKTVIDIFSFIFITFYGYSVHMLSHELGTKLSDSYENIDNVFTRNTYFNWFIKKSIIFSEFHAKTHHNSEINKTTMNITLEILNNIMTQGGLIICFKYFFNLIDNRVILLWALFYATIHNINYNIESPLTHRHHHLNDRTNYGIDMWDIIMGTKYDDDVIETHNHSSINLILITALILFITKI